MSIIYDLASDPFTYFLLCLIDKPIRAFAIKFTNKYTEGRPGIREGDYIHNYTIVGMSDGELRNAVENVPYCDQIKFKEYMREIICSIQNPQLATDMLKKYYLEIVEKEKKQNKEATDLLASYGIFI